MRLDRRGGSGNSPAYCLEFAPESGGSGIDNVFTNAKWLMKASGMYTLPWYGINLAANGNFRQGYPFP